MTRVRAYAARAARPRLEACIARLREVPTDGQALILGPTRVALDELVLESLPAGAATFGLHRRTSTGLASELAGPSLASRGVAMAPPLSLEAVVRRVVRRALEAGRLPILGRAAEPGAPPVAAAPSFPVAVRATLDDLRLNAVTPDALRGLGGRTAELGHLAAAFEAELARAGLADRSLMLAEARGLAATSIYSGLPLVSVDVPLRSAMERDFFGALLAAASDAVVVIPHHDHATRAALEHLGFEVEPLPEPASPDAVALGRLRERLFEETLDGDLPDRVGVGLASAADEPLEAVEVVRRCLAEAARGTPFDRIAVAVPARGGYAAHLEAAFDRAGVPVCFEGGTRRPHPAGRALLLLLRCRAERGSGRRLAEYLASAQMPATPVLQPVASPLSSELDASLSLEDDTAEAAASEELAARIPFRKWARMLGDLGVVAAGWGSPLAPYLRRRIAAFRAELESAAAFAARDAGDTPAVDASAGELAALDDLEKRLSPLVERLDAVPMRATWREHLDALEAVAPYAVRRPELPLAVLEELRVLAADEDPVELEEVLDVLEPRLEALQRPPPKRGYGRVLVTRPAALRGRARAVVLFMGLGERVFPERVRQDPILLDRERRALDPLLPTRHALALEQRATLMVTVGAAERGFFGSFSRGDAALGRSRVASLYALEIGRAILGHVPDLGALDELSRGASGARLAWPAPSSPEQGVDDMEYELSLVSELSRRTEAEARGALRFLLSRHVHLDRALRFRFRREKRGVSSADGFYASDAAVRARSAARSLTLAPSSPSSLEAYAACPYRFYLRSMVRLRPREDLVPVEQMDPMTRGEIYHRCQAFIARELKKESTSAALDPARTHELVLAAIRAEMARITALLEPLVPSVFQASAEAIERDLHGWVDDVVRAKDGYAPLAAELGFGADGGLDVRGGFKLRGAIDAVEIDGARRLRITDYKTGRVPEELGAVLAVGRGRVLQPVLYALAVEALRGTPPIPEDGRLTAARLYFATDRGGYEERAVELREDVLEKGREVLGRIDEAIRAGVMMPLPDAGACERCDYRVVCGDDAERRARSLVARDATPEGRVAAGLAWLRGQL